jgi:hypothetical protein
LTAWWSQILAANDFHRTTLIAAITVRIVQIAGDEIVDVDAMWDCFVAATGSMNVSSIVSGAAMVWRATIRVLVTHFNPMLRR